MNKTKKIIEKYFNHFTSDKDDLECLINQMSLTDDIFDRKNFTGHIVANALVLNSNNEILTVFHNTLKMYLQPGGHVDSTDKSVLNASIRELLEETGISEAKLDEWHNKSGIPIFIESHKIPPNEKKAEDEHFHHDLLYIFRTDTLQINLQLEEVSNYKWTSIDNVLNLNPESYVGKALTRMIELKIIKIN